jgi:hypothetical protein
MEVVMQTKVTLEIIVQSLLIGAGATLVMDAWLLVLARMGLPAMNFALVGRFVGHLSRGRWTHEGVARAAPIRGEAALGWTAHYAIGIFFAALLVLVEGPDWARAPTFLPALITGIVTVSAPFFILQPAMGAGIASSRTRTPLLNSLRSLANHVVFGVGLYLAALACAHVRTNWV